MKCFSFFFKRKKPGNAQNSNTTCSGNNTDSKIGSISATETGTTHTSSSSLNRSTARSLPSPRSIRDLYSQRESNLRAFSYKELSDATNGFNRMFKIGEGGFGSVYKGTVRVSGPGSPLNIVAIKKLNQQGLQGHKQWLAEVEYLGVVNHPNVVKLLGYCAEDGERGIQRLLVYEFMPNRSLEDHLFPRNRYPTFLSWKHRLLIMLGAAQGLAYLHGGLEIEIIYRDFKAANVLLDDDFRPKLSDFGLAREGPDDCHTHVSTARVGTHGYAAPEYVETGHLRSQSDVWSFGVVLYEILAGRRIIERNKPAEEQNLLDWVKQYPADSRRFTMIVDPRLRNNYPVRSARKVAKLADMCLNRKYKERPTMAFVAENLREIIDESDAAAAKSNTKSPVTVSGSTTRKVSVRG